MMPCRGIGCPMLKRLLTSRIVKPKKERLEEALESLRMKQQILAEARAKLRELSEMIARLQAEYDEKVRLIYVDLR